MKERDSFYKSWFIACGNPKSLIHDTTSISTYSKKINDSEWGYNRDKEKLKQINMALVVSEEKQLPLWYRIIPGSIPDVSTLNPFRRKVVYTFAFIRVLVCFESMSFHSFQLEKFSFDLKALFASG